MSVCQSGQTEDDSASEEVGASATRDIYKQKPTSKVVRVLTVLAYLLSVSLAAILLSVYYVCVWKSPVLPLQPQPEDAGEMSARRAHHPERHAEYAAHTSHSYGGGDTTVNGDIIHTSPGNLTSGFADDDVSTEPTSDTTPTLNSTGLPVSTPAAGHNGTSDDIGSFDHTDGFT